MDIQTSKIELAKLILNIENAELINKIADLIKKDDFWDELSVEQKQEIELGIQQADNGQVIPWKDVLKKIS
ncbi:hypothetical protein G5B37_03500 [Rasiella rasia]|uniref:Addiction module component n=1 Tax=Rasiella rasia TaxID=2744027 RepID=A0A6G6GJF6_9FLAO|nr:hypothetical protein [Rasiella rasia]QIE58657.1 hypothetical protein G5B37_03500 [Rasiella rasia]